MTRPMSREATTLVAVGMMLFASSAWAQYGREQVPQPPDARPQEGAGARHPDDMRDETPGQEPRHEKEPRGTSTKGAGSFATEPETGSPPARPPGATPEQQH